MLKTLEPMSTSLLYHSFGIQSPYHDLSNTKKRVQQSLPLRFIPPPKVRYTRDFERYVLSLSIEKMTMSSIETR